MRGRTPSPLDRVRGWRRRLRALVNRRAAERDLHEELAFHLAMEEEKHRRAGLDPAAARRAARLAFGGVDRFSEEVRDVRNLGWLEDLRQDLRHAARSFRRAPGFTLAAVAALGLGIGANTAVFSVVHGVVLAPLPYADADRIVRVWETRTAQAIDYGTVSPGTVVDLRASSRTLEHVAIVGGRDMLFEENGERWEARVAAVSPVFFDILGIPPLLGQTFASEVRVPRAGPGGWVVLGHDTWRTRFGGDPDIVGRAIRLDHRWTYTIVGVMPPELDYPAGTEVWTAVDYGPTVSAEQRQYRFYDAIAKLRPGATLEQASSEAAAIAARLETEYPASNAGWTVRLAPLKRSIVGDTRVTLLVLLGLAGCVLLIASANVATLAVARATARGHETAVRLALGAGSRRLVRQWAAEGLLLALLGGVAGVMVGYWSSDVLLALAPSGIPRLDQVTFSGPVLAFALLTTLAAAIIVALAPAFRARGGGILDALRGRSETAGRTSARTREWLLGAQVALTFVLLVCATLLVRSFDRLRSTELGFRAHDVLSAELRVPRGRFTADPPWYQRLQYYERLMTELDAMPGVRSVAGTSNIPFTGGVATEDVWRTDAPGAFGDSPPTSAADRWTPAVEVVTPHYFETVGVPIVRGRGFVEEDRFPERQLTNPTPPLPVGVALINETMARRYWPSGDPVGASITVYRDRAAHRTIVGVVRDLRTASVDSAPEPTVYLPFAQYPGRELSLVLRSEIPPAQLAGPVAERLRAFGDEITIRRVEPLHALVGEALSRPRFSMQLVGSFALLALVIAAVGVFGIVGYLVARRTHEIGIRMALGARPRSVFRLVLGEGMRPVLLGLVVGCAGAIAAARAMRAMLYELAPLDVVSFAAAAVVLVIAALVAAVLPAWRAMGVDPLRALRSQ